MSKTIDLEVTLLDTIRSLPLDDQQEVLQFAQSLRSKTLPPLTLTLQEIAKLPIADRNRILEPYMEATAEDFCTDPELTEFSILDSEDWEDA
jgi:hypothetical protein